MEKIPTPISPESDLEHQGVKKGEKYNLGKQCKDRLSLMGIIGISIGILEQHVMQAADGTNIVQRQPATNSVEKLPIVDINVEGQRVLLSKEDIDKMQKTIADILRMQREMQLSFNSEVQKNIVELLGDKLKQGLLKAKEIGFEFNERDTFHAHLIVEKDSLPRLKQAFLDGDKILTPKISREVLKEVKALIFHTAEWPTEENLKDPEYWSRYPKRTICVDEKNIVSTLLPQKDKMRPTSAMGLPDFGGKVGDLNRLQERDYVDLALFNQIGFFTDIQFLPNEKVGVKLDEKLPAIRFILTLEQSGGM